MIIKENLCINYWADEIRKQERSQCDSQNCAWVLFWLYRPQHLLLNLGSVVWFALRGRGGVVLRAKWDAMRGLPRVWWQRQRIQKQRRVNGNDIRRAMTPNWTVLARFVRIGRS